MGRTTKILKASYLYWKKIAEEKPDYRDAYIQAGSLTYQLDNIDEAKRLLQKAQDLDPNFNLPQLLFLFCRGFRGVASWGFSTVAASAGTTAA